VLTIQTLVLFCPRPLGQGKISSFSDNYGIINHLGSMSVQHNGYISHAQCVINRKWGVAQIPVHEKTAYCARSTTSNFHSSFVSRCSKNRRERLVQVSLSSPCLKQFTSSY